MNFSDIGLIIAGIFTAGTFAFLGTDRLYRFYFGIILGFLLFLVFNLQIKLGEIGGKGGEISGWHNFLQENKEMILGFFSVMIPIFGVLFSTIDSEIKSNRVFSILFGFLLPIFILGVLGYIVSSSAMTLIFLGNILGFFTDSIIFDILQKSPKLIFGLLLIIIFWKYIFSLIIIILGHFAKLIISEINDLRGIENDKNKD